MIRWEPGRAGIDKLLTSGQLTRVTANRVLADQYLAQAQAHLALATRGVKDDPPGSFQLVYDAARKSLAAILINQGLRPSGQGAHVTVLEAVLLQLEPPRQEAFREFAWMRRLRNETEYPSDGKLPATPDDVRSAIPIVQQIIDRANKVLDAMPPY